MRLSMSPGQRYNAIIRCRRLFRFRETMSFKPNITSRQRARIAAGLCMCIDGEGVVYGNAMPRTGCMPAGAGGTT